MHIFQTIPKDLSTFYLSVLAVDDVDQTLIKNDLNVIREEFLEFRDLYCESMKSMTKHREKRSSSMPSMVNVGAEDSYLKNHITDIAFKFR